MSVWEVTAVIGAMVVATTVSLVLFQRSLDKPGGRESWGVTGGDVFGPVVELLNPGEHRSRDNVREHEARQEVVPAPGPGLDRPVTVRRTADGSIVVGRPDPV